MPTTPNFRTDAQLRAILDETAEWVVYVAGGLTLARAASLRDALTMAGQYAAAGKIVRAVSRRDPDDIVIPAEQALRLSGRLEEPS